MKLKHGLTAHVMVRNEPFVFYSAMSVYPYVDKILIWDTGSDDETLSDIQELLALDYADKIDFQQKTIETDERYWKACESAQLRKANEGKKGKGVVRQEMIDATETSFFLILDGDEVWYKQGILGVLDWVNSSSAIESRICARTPLRWFCSMSAWFWLTSSTRVFKTDRVIMHTASPGEMHMNKDNPTVNSLNIDQPGVTVLDGILPYAHYETYLKPWRREPDPDKVRPFSLMDHPGVLHEYPKYLSRFEEKLAKGEVRARI